MRTVRPPPKVVPPRPPAHLFEPTDPRSALGYAEKPVDPPTRSYPSQSQPTRLQPDPRNESDSSSSRYYDYRRDTPPARVEPRDFAPPPRDDGFDRDVAEQMKQFEIDFLRMMGTDKVQDNAAIDRNIDDYRERSSYRDTEAREMPRDSAARYDRIPPTQAEPRPAYPSPRPAYPRDEPDRLHPPHGQPSPARRKTGMNSLYETDDQLRRKAEKQAAYSQQLQQQMKEKVGFKDRQEQQVVSPQQKPREEVSTGLAIGMDRARELELKRQRQQQYKALLDAETPKKAVKESAGTGLAIGLDKESEQSLRRRKQQEYKQYLDQQSQHKQNTLEYDNRRHVPPPPQRWPSQTNERDFESHYDAQIHVSRTPRGDSSFLAPAREAEPVTKITNPVSSTERDRRRIQQEEYRRQLELQVQSRKQLEEEEKKKLKEEDEKFLAEVEGRTPPRRDKDMQRDPHRHPQPQRDMNMNLNMQREQRDRQYQSDTAVEAQRDFYRDPQPRRDVDMDMDRHRDPYRDLPPRRDADMDREPPRDPRPRRELDMQRGLQRDLQRDPPPRRDTDLERGARRELDVRRDPEYRAQSFERPPDVSERAMFSPRDAAPSPTRSPQPARQQLVQDMYARNSLLAHHEAPNDQGWKPSGKNSTDRQRAAINEQRAALDRQIAEAKRLKDEEEQKEKEAEEKRMRRAEEVERTKREKEELLKREKEAAQRAQEDKEKEKMRPVESLNVSMQSKDVGGGEKGFDHISSPLRSLMDEERERQRKIERYYDRAGPAQRAPSVAPDDAMDDLVRRFERDRDLNRDKELDRDLRYTEDRGRGREWERDRERGYGERIDRDRRERYNEDLHYGSQDSDSHMSREEFLYKELEREREKARERDRLRERDNERFNRESLRGREGYLRDEREGDAPRGYRDSDQRRYDEERRDDFDRYGRGSFEGVHFDRNENREDRLDRNRNRNREMESNAARQNSPPRPSIANEDTDVDVSFVCESRFIPANPWSSSGIVSDLLPLHTIPEQIRRGDLAKVPALAVEPLQRAARPPPRSYGDQKEDLEQSLASNSMFVFLGRQTPATGSRPSVTPAPLVNTRVVQLNTATADAPQSRPLSRTRTPERIDPAMMPAAGRPSSRQEGIEVRRSVPQESLPSAEEIPKNRFFINKVQSISSQQDNPSSPIRRPRTESRDRPFLEPPSFLSQNDDELCVITKNDVLMHQNGSPASGLRRLESANDEMQRNRGKGQGRSLFEMEQDATSSSGKNSSTGRPQLHSGGSGSGGRKWDVSEQSKGDILRQLSHQIVPLSSPEQRFEDDLYEQESFESAE